MLSSNLENQKNQTQQVSIGNKMKKKNDRDLNLRLKRFFFLKNFNKIIFWKMVGSFVETII